MLTRLSRRGKFIGSAISVALTLVLFYGLAQVPLAEWTWVDYFYAMLYGASLALMFAYGAEGWVKGRTDRRR